MGVSAALLLLWALAVPAAAEPIPVLIVNGQNNHDWKTTTQAMRDTLLASGRFTVEVSTSPPNGADGAAWEAWRPRFSDYRALVLDYNGQMWPEQVQEDFLNYVRDGGGAVFVHAANNPFAGWKAYDRLIGLGWRGAEYGDRITINDATGKVQRPYHPIMKGLPARWLHARDELYHGQRGPAQEMTVLSSAFSDKQTGGTGAHEPITWFIPFGKGKAVTTVMGHQGRGQQDLDALQCVGFQTVLSRSVEWVATGKVTIPVPADFPSAGKTSIHAPAPPAAQGLALPPGYRLLYRQDFGSEKPLGDFVFSDAKAWRLGEAQNRKYLEQFQASGYQPPVRSPRNIALIAPHRFSSFVLEAELMQTGKEYGHRDMCLFFGFQDPSHYYYAHVSTKSDDHAHNIFIVNGSPRTKISTRTTAGHDWGREKWHKVRLVRDAESGKIEIYVNDMSKPIMVASDKAFSTGYIGFGSFDDTGRVSRVRVWAPGAEEGAAKFFGGPTAR